jgi:hypothetical protein
VWTWAWLVVATGSIAESETVAQQSEPKSSASKAKRDRAWVESRVRDWQPTPEERAFDQIAWAKNLIEAKRLAKEHRRPIFLFTYDGANMACYRC